MKKRVLERLAYAIDHTKLQLGIAEPGKAAEGTGVIP